jgi:hypothetical protein
VIMIWDTEKKREREREGEGRRGRKKVEKEEKGGERMRVICIQSMQYEVFQYFTTQLKIILSWRGPKYNT